MQPYFFPYIGYFQLMRAVDVFVFHDDAQYIKGGWVNRNRIRTGDRSDWLSLPVAKGSNFLPINERHYSLGGDSIPKMKRRLSANYAKSPAYREILPVIFDLLDFADSNVAHFNIHLLTALARKLDIPCRFVNSSDMPSGKGLKGQSKVIALCKALDAHLYINPIGGTALYEASTFAESGLALEFLRTRVPTASSGPEHPYLSIIDELMQSGIERCRTLLDYYVLERPAPSGG
jgi:hypothetical protein